MIMILLFATACTDNPAEPQPSPVTASVTAPSQAYTGDDVRFSSSCSSDDGLQKKASLRQTLERLNGRNFTPDELHEGIDLEAFFGRHCNILVVHNPTEDRVYASIDVFMPYNGSSGLVAKNAKNSSGELMGLNNRPVSTNDVSKLNKEIRF